jgi:hypothetical protein
VYDAIAAKAAATGVAVAESELIGLAPVASLLAVADHAGEPAGSVEARLASAARYVRLRNFSPMQALELRLAAAGATASP